MEAVTADFAELRLTGAEAAHALYRTAAGPRLVNATGEPGNLTLLLGFLSADSTYDVNVTTFPGPTASRVVVRTPGQEVAWAAAGTRTIQPGAMTTSGATLNFVLRDARNETLYILSAGHSFLVGQEVTLQYDGVFPENHPFGDVVAQSTAAATGDWALIRIRATDRTHVSPQVKWYGGPVGPPPEPLPRGAEVCAFGQGIFLGPDELRARCGHFLAVALGEGGEPRGFLSSMRSRPGDSGAPVVHPSTGHAWGMLLGGVPEGSLTLADATCWTLDRVRDAGYDLELATAMPLRGGTSADVPLAGAPFDCGP